MRVFVYEHITGGGLVGQALPASLLAEGEAMLYSLLEDLLQAGVELCTTRDGRLGPVPAGARATTVASAREWQRAWGGGLEWCDAVWPIAPEGGGLLTALSRRIVAAGRILLGSRPAAVALASSKLATSRRLAQTGVAVVPTWPVRAAPADLRLPCVVKPDDGAGCEDTWMIERREDLCAWRGAARDAARYVVQPFVPGVPASMSLLCAAEGAELLACNRQRVTIEGAALRFDGTEVDVLRQHAREWAPLAEAIARAVPGLWGYVGVDLVQGAGGPVVLEINPRLTTSYCGLARGPSRNPAAAVLGLAAAPRRRLEADAGRGHAG
jgi:predicted ATP-grasp superfamily ATP-dependent carboligase